MTTQTLMEADRYLVNKGFVCTPLTDLGDQYQARYTFGRFKTKTDSGITLTLHDYGDGRWTYSPIGFSKGLDEMVREVNEALRRLPGFEPDRI